MTPFLSVPQTHSNGKANLLALALFIFGMVATTLGITVGVNGLDNLVDLSNDPTALQIIWDIRLPRTLGALMAGALLGLSGSLAQGLFRNPLADPYLLGSASGASLGVALALVLCAASPIAPPWIISLGLTGAAFVGAMGAVFLTLLLAKGAQQTLRLLLGGVIVGVVLGALCSVIMLMDPHVMQIMQTFMLGSISLVGWSSVKLMSLVWIICMVVSWSLSRVLDALSLGEATARSLGLRLNQMRSILIAVLALAIGGAVAQTGLIAFVGLASPHLVRSVVRVKHSQLLFLSSLTGAVLLLSADLGARWLIAPQELPVGVLTAVVGGGYLLWLMHNQNVGPRN